MKLRAALLSLMLATAAWSASGVEAMRASAASLRADVAQLRGEQLSRRNELSVVSSRIEALKAQTKGALVAGSELDRSLKRSQELSGTLTELAQRLSTRELELETANVALLEGLSGELTRLRSEFDRQSDRGARRGLIDQMRRLRAERESVRAALPAARLPTVTLTPTDDPEQLLEQADLLRDNEEKVRRELKALETRISQRREEVELDRRVQRFMGEESMFDDQDRRLRLQRRDSEAGEAPAATGAPKTDGVRGEAANTGFTNATDPSPQSPAITAGSAPPDRTPPPFSSPLAGTRSANENTFAPTSDSFGPGGGSSPSGALDSRGVSITSSSDARPQVGAGTRSIATGDDDEMDDLDVQRTRLQGLANELKRKAGELEKKASQLR